MIKDTVLSENTPEVAVIDYGMGNLRSVAKAFEHEGGCIRIVREPETVGDVAGLILPGVGAFGDCMAALKQNKWDDFIRAWITEDRPFFGICLGLQALFEYSEESSVAGLSIFSGQVVRFDSDAAFKVPHMGWNTVRFRQTTPINKGLNSDGEYFYFVHSYYACPEDPTLIWCDTDYGVRFVSGITRGSCFATQFHPEKSQDKGLYLYRNFVKMISQA